MEAAELCCAGAGIGDHDDLPLINQWSIDEWGPFDHAWQSQDMEPDHESFRLSLADDLGSLDAEAATDVSSSSLCLSAVGSVPSDVVQTTDGKMSPAEKALAVKKTVPYKTRPKKSSPAVLPMSDTSHDIPSLDTAGADEKEFIDESTQTDYPVGKSRPITGSVRRNLTQVRACMQKSVSMSCLWLSG